MDDTPIHTQPLIPFIMKFIKYLVVGIIFGIIMTKSEAVSWFRIQEMFRFESFHMYGIIGTAVILGAMVTFLIKKSGMKSIGGAAIQIPAKPANYKAALIGGTIFGLGWAMTGACPGPLFTLLGHGVWTILLVIASAVLGTFVYGVMREKLPH